MSETRPSRRFDRNAKYIDLKINGRLFPSWVMANFKQYKLKDVFHKGGEDPCNIQTDEGQIKKDLRDYQVFLSQFLDFRSPYHTQLIYHGLTKTWSVTAGCHCRIGTIMDKQCIPINIIPASQSLF